MTEAHKKGLDAGLVGNDLENCCRKETTCGQCQKSNCIIGYGKQCINDYKQAPKKEVAQGMAHIPTMDFKVFDEVELETAIAHILKECKDCKEDHTEDCIINVIRSCYEVGLLGDVQPYEGSALQYLMYIKENFPDKSLQIADLYRS
ncbi:hypothetical protein D7V90_16720 [bacterium 1xD42-87]|jgi:hypothetical protein|nr:hypothetical protein D7V90_16720 [bacterium 1xD42-87]